MYCEHLWCELWFQNNQIYCTLIFLIICKTKTKSPDEDDDDDEDAEDENDENNDPNVVIVEV